MRLKGRIALVTGASRGIGWAVAKAYAREGAHVIAAARTQGALEELDDAILAQSGERATLVPMDLRDGAKIDQMGAAIYQRFGRLDILVANAGSLGMLAPVGHVELKVWDEAVAVNLTANWRLIRSMDPLLRASDAGRAIFVTSDAARAATPFWGAYAATKAALETMVRTYAVETAFTRVRTNLLDPGPVRTRLRATAFPGEDPNSLPAPESVTEAFISLALASENRNGELIRA